MQGCAGVGAGLQRPGSKIRCWAAVPQSVPGVPKRHDLRTFETALLAAWLAALHEQAANLCMTMRTTGAVPP